MSTDVTLRARMATIGRFAQEYGWGAARKNGRKNYSLKEERASMALRVLLQ